LPLLKRREINTTFHAQWQTLPFSILAKKEGLVDTIFNAAHARELLFNPFDGIPFLSDKYEHYCKWALSKADFHFPVSEYTADLLVERGVSRDQIEVIGNGTNPDQFYPTEVDELRNELGFNGKKILLTITRLVPRKGVDTVIKAMGQLRDEYSDLKYLVVGDGEQMEELKALSEKLNLSDRVTFAGRVPHEKLNAYYNLGDIFVMPSKTMEPDVEGFGIVFLEANACGKPVIGSRSGGIPSAIVEDETGLLVDEDNPNQLAQKISHLLEHPDVAARLGKRGRERILHEANWDSVAEKMYNIMQHKFQQR
jgi:phosphatidylinositol alpha-1,6-mannosyltransferase